MQQDPYIRVGEVAELLSVSPQTVARWAREGRIANLRTLGGHRRYRLADIEALAAARTEAVTGDQSGTWHHPPAGAAAR